MASAYTCCHPCQLHQTFTWIAIPLSKCNQNMQTNCKHVIINVHMGVIFDEFLTNVSPCWTRKQRCPHYTVVHLIQTHVWGLGVRHDHSPMNGTRNKCWKTLANFPFRWMAMYIECNAHMYSCHMDGIAIRVCCMF